MFRDRVRRRTGSGLFLAALAAVASISCYDFHLAGPEDPASLPSPRVVSVVIEYRQPNECINSVARCGEAVVFFGSWMRPGAEFQLRSDPGSHVWTGVAQNVPVNFPPSGDPYRVKVFDPYLRESLTEGFTAERLRLGGQTITTIDGSGGRNEAGLVYIDQDGQARNAF